LQAYLGIKINQLSVERFKHHIDSILAVLYLLGNKTNSRKQPKAKDLSSLIKQSNKHKWTSNGLEIQFPWNLSGKINSARYLICHIPARWMYDNSKHMPWHGHQTVWKITPWHKG
jgi:hypothetical protein